MEKGVDIDIQHVQAALVCVVCRTIRRIFPKARIIDANNLHLERFRFELNSDLDRKRKEHLESLESGTDNIYEKEARREEIEDLTKKMGPIRADIYYAITYCLSVCGFQDKYFVAKNTRLYVRDKCELRVFLDHNVMSTNSDRLILEFKVKHLR